MILITERLRAASQRTELPKIIAWLQARGIAHVYVIFGFGNLDSRLNERRRLIPVETIRLPDFIRDAEARGAFAFGGGDELSIYDTAIVRLKADDTFEVRDDVSTTIFTFSHENTMNLETNDEQFLEEVRRSWLDRGIKNYRHDPRFVRGEHGPLPVNNRRFRFEIQQIKHWREVESEAGRPSGLADLYAAHDVCSDCRGEGICMIGWSKPIGTDELEAAEALQIEELPLYAVCARCGGNGTSVR